MVMGYWSVATLFWQLSIDHIVNVLYKIWGLAKTRLRHPSLPFDSLPYPTRTICRRVRTYARSVTWQPNEKRLTIFHEYGALSDARFARAGAPLLSIGWSKSKIQNTNTNTNTNRNLDFEVRCFWDSRKELPNLRPANPQEWKTWRLSQNNRWDWAKKWRFCRNVTWLNHPMYTYVKVNY